MERPIIFNSEMINAILDGRKTQTRRIANDIFNWWRKDLIEDELKKISKMWWMPDDYWEAAFKDGRSVLYKYHCKYGKPNDRLWVKETWRGGNDTLENVFYKASDNCNLKYGFCQCFWKSPIFMTREFSRLNLDIKYVRAERLNDISEEDAKSEGVEPDRWHEYYAAGPGHDCQSYRKGFIRTWESIKGKGSWALNPWVWVIDFKKV